MRVSHPHRRITSSSIEAVAGNGLLNRRALLGRGAILVGGMTAGPLQSLTGAAAEPPGDTPLSEIGRAHV